MLILDAVDAVAARVLESVLMERPGDAPRWGGGSRKSWLEDVRHDVRYLAAAVEFDAPATFTSYLLWARETQAARGVHPNHLLVRVRALRGVLVSGDAEGLVTRHSVPVLDAGEKALAHARPLTRR